MSTDAHFKASLNQLFVENQFQFIVESGTYLGLGSTTTIAHAILNAKSIPPRFYTLEIDKTNFLLARQNLEKFPFVLPVWGVSVNKDEAMRFIDNDEAINHHEKFPEVFIDTLTNPAAFYKAELEGQLFKNEAKISILQKIGNVLGVTQKHEFEFDFFEKKIPEIRTTIPLFLLDSSGGIGFLEFQKMHQLMDGNPYWLILDDIHHLKHFRSYEFVKNSKDFEIYASDFSNGWLIAKYR